MIIITIVCMLICLVGYLGWRTHMESTRLYCEELFTRAFMMSVICGALLMLELLLINLLLNNLGELYA